MAVANRKLHMVKKLIEPLNAEDRERLIETRVTGEFFQKNVDSNENVQIWYGETALAFAIVTEQQDIVNYLVDAGADIMQQDVHGDSVFHLCIYKNLYDMFNFLLELYDHKNNGDKKARLRLFNQIKNKKNETLSDHAAFLGRYEIFERILQLTSEVGWVWGDLEYRCYPISDIDDNNDGLQESILEVVVAEGHRNFQRHTLIHFLLTQKWLAFGRNAFLIWFFVHVLWTVAETFTFTTINPNKSKSIMSVLGDENGYIQVAFAFALTKPFIMFINETLEIIYLIRRLGVMRGIKTYFDTDMDVIAIAKWLTLFHMICSTVFILNLFGNDWNIFISMGSFMVFADWIHTLIFFLISEHSRMLVISMAHIFTQDAPSLIGMYLVVLFGSATSFYMLDADHQDNDFWFYVNNAIQVTVGHQEQPINEISEVTAVKMAYRACYLAFVILVIILLFNLFIAVFTETHLKTEAERELEWLHCKASLVLLMQRKKYWFNKLCCKTARIGLKGSSMSLMQSDEYYVGFVEARQKQERVTVFLPQINAENFERFKFPMTVAMADILDFDLSLFKAVEFEDATHPDNRRVVFCVDSSAEMRERLKDLPSEERMTKILIEHPFFGLTNTDSSAASVRSGLMKQNTLSLRDMASSPGKSPHGGDSPSIKHELLPTTSLEDCIDMRRSPRGARE